MAKITFYPRLNKVKNYLPEHLIDQVQVTGHIGTLKIILNSESYSEKDFLSIFKVLKNNMSFHMLLDIICLDHKNTQEIQQESKKRFELQYLLLNMEDHIRLRVCYQFNEKIEITGLASIWSSATWLENEIHDLFGVKFNKNYSRFLLADNFKGHPLRKDYVEEEIDEMLTTKPLLEVNQSVKKVVEDEEYCLFTSNNIHPGGVPKVHGHIKGDEILKLKIELGNNHRGFEKVCERKNVHQVIPIFERLNFNSASLNGFLWCNAIEKMLDIEIPERAMALRMVFSELDRIHEHLLFLIHLFYEYEIDFDFWGLIDFREHLLTLVQAYSGRRVLANLGRIGGMGADLPLEWRHQCQKLLDAILIEINDIDKKLVKLRVIKDRAQVGRLDASEIINFGITGPIMRAVGINYDIRKTSPYYFYEQVDFDVPLGLKGTTYDRYLVRIEEIRQSINIIGQVMDNLPLGSVINKEWDFSQMKTIHENEQLNEAFFKIARPSLPNVEEYTSIESPNGELGVYIKGMDHHHPYRVKVRTPSFSNYQALPLMMKNNSVGEFYPVYASLNINLSELER